MTAAPPFWRLDIHETLGSTSDLCRERAEAGEPEGLAVLALRQTSGRGTHGRSWTSPPGNLYLSVLLRPGGGVAGAPQWGLLAAVALIEALAPLRPEPGRLRLKWPNDVLLDGAKLAGVLVEVSADAAGGVAWLVIGIGANLAVAPEVPDRPTARIGPDAPAPEVFAAALLARLAAWRARLGADGFAPVRAAWLAFGPAHGTAVRLRQGERIRDGAFAGLDADGSLLLRADGMVRAFSAGET